MNGQRWWSFVSLGCSLVLLGAAQAFELKVPLGLPKEAMNIPEDNPITPDKIALGKQLFFDPRLSIDDTVSCATCHNPNLGFSDGLPTSIGIKGQKLPRNSMTTINRAFSTLQLWYGRWQSLEEQVLKAIPNPIAFGNTWEEVEQKLNRIQGYREQFQKVFGTDVTANGVAKAIAAYERVILSGNSLYDRFQTGDRSALSHAAVRGLAVFMGKGNCVQCHVGFNFTDESFHNIGVGMDRPEPDLGRYNVTKREEDNGAFKTPTLRDIAKTAPYMHDGTFRTLEEVVEFYNQGGIPIPYLSKAIRSLNLTAQEKADLVEFLKSLTGEIDPALTSLPEMPR